MGMMDSVASMAMSLQSVRVSQSYDVALARKVLDSQEQMASEMLNMLPQQPMIPKGDFIDVYA